MNFKEKRVLVTGGAGFIGSQVIKQLIDYDAKVTVLDNFSSGKKEYLPKNKNLKYLITDTNGKILKNSFDLNVLLKNTNWKKL